MISLLQIMRLYREAQEFIVKVDLEDEFEKTDSGVYIFISKDYTEVYYIGETANMNERMRNQLSCLDSNRSNRFIRYLVKDKLIDIQDKNAARNWIINNCMLLFLRLSDKKERKLLEAYLSYALDVKYIG